MGAVERLRELDEQRGVILETPCTCGHPMKWHATSIGCFGALAVKDGGVSGRSCPCPWFSEPAEDRAI